MRPRISLKCNLAKYGRETYDLCGFVNFAVESDALAAGPPTPSFKGGFYT